MSNPDVLIVGGGLAGLCCAYHLHRSGIRPLVLEADEVVGGRVKTEEVDGFLLDRGFQVLLTAYPEARKVLDYPALKLRPFYPGAQVRFGGSFHRLADPRREPADAMKAALSPIGSPLDKLRILRSTRRLLRKSPPEILEQQETTTLRALRNAGYSGSMINRFFRPFLGGVFLDRSLDTSSRMWEFVFQMFAQDDAALPAGGMGAIPRQVASRLPADAVRTGAWVERVEKGAVTLLGGERIQARAVVVATEGWETPSFLPELKPVGAKGVTCVYFSASEPPIREPLLVLDGDGIGPVNNLAVPSNVQPSYAPRGKALISATVLGVPEITDDALEAAIRAQMTVWFGRKVKAWQHLRTYRIPDALPLRTSLSVAQRSVRAREGVYLCGDYRDTPSIQGAMASGRRAADAVREDLNR